MKIWPNFAIKLQKMVIFLKNPLFFKIFCAYGGQNLEFYVPKFPIFGVDAPLGTGLNK